MARPELTFHVAEWATPMPRRSRVRTALGSGWWRGYSDAAIAGDLAALVDRPTGKLTLMAIPTGSTGSEPWSGVDSGHPPD